MFCNRAEAFFVLTYNRIRNTCDLRTIINTVSQLLLKLIRYKHRLNLLEPRNYPFFLCRCHFVLWFITEFRFKILSWPPIHTPPLSPLSPSATPSPPPPPPLQKKKTQKNPQKTKTQAHTIRAGTLFWNINKNPPPPSSPQTHKLFNS